ncbi:MAG: replication-relaxation family protein [Candidatus Zixiibacteriota bacterium]
MSKPTQQKRLSRYVPDKGAFPDLILRDRDYKILRLVYDHRFLSSELIWHLLQTGDVSSGVSYAVGSDGKQRPAQYGFGRQALSKRLKQLFNARYLERHYITDEPMGRGHGSPRAIYGLGPACPKILEERHDIPIKITRRIIESNKVKSLFLKHALGVATFRATLELACERHSDEAKLLFWEQGDCIRDFVIGENEEGEDERIPVHADAFFGLEVVGAGRTHFFLEIDRGTEPIASSKQRTDIRRKLIGYRLYRKSKKFPKRYAYRQLPNGQIVGLDIRADQSNEGRHMITGFQVLFVTPGAIRQDKTLSGRIASIFAEFASMGKFYVTNSLFWFTSPDSIDITEPDRMFSKCWITANPQNDLMSMVE